MTENIKAHKENTVYRVTANILFSLNQNLESRSTRAILSNLRSSINKPISNSIDAFATVYSLIPDEFISEYDNLSYEEKAIITTLQLYALHQQGKNETVLYDLSEEKAYLFNMGRSLKVLRTEDSNASDRRFNAMITADTFDELTHHLRQLINLLKSRSSVKVNYAKLAEDLYYFQRGYKEEMRLRWARDYYRYSKESENKGEIND